MLPISATQIPGIFEISGILATSIWLGTGQVTYDRSTNGESFMQSTTNPIRWTTADLAIFESDRSRRYEIIDGELFVTRAPDWKHQAVCGNKD